MRNLEIEPIRESHRRTWEPLWLGYHEFYQRKVPAPLTEYTWHRLVAADEIRGLLASDEHGEGLGIAHFLFHPSTSSMGGNCYFQDLFVKPDARGLGIGHRLITAVADAARGRGAEILYWQTEEFNGTARRLYERVAKRSPFIRYNIEL